MTIGDLLVNILNTELINVFWILLGLLGIYLLISVFISSYKFKKRITEANLKIDPDYETNLKAQQKKDLILQLKIILGGFVFMFLFLLILELF